VDAEAEGASIYDLTIDDFPPDGLAAIVSWCNDPAINKELLPSSLRHSYAVVVELEHHADDSEAFGGLTSGRVQHTRSL
jgi:hypothetical protein